MTDKYFVYRPMLDLIGLAEGTDIRPDGRPARGYNETLAYGALTNGDVELTEMTLDQVDKLQLRMLRHPKNKWKSSAVGRPQIVRKTMREIRRVLRLDGSELFDADMQDRMACFLLGRRGIDKWLAGRMREATLLDQLAMEWASLPNAAGRGHNSGQDARVSVQRVRGALAEVRARHRATAPHKEVVPPEVDREVEKKTGWWQWLTGLFGGGGIGGGFLWGLDWQTLAVMVAAVVMLILLFLLFKRHVLSGIRDLRATVEAE
ncbi:MAG: hypothetical protein ABJG86_11055 [Nitratireductor sp.]